ncbi:MAG: ACT domain-containing protein [Pseudomonadota bacterium]
MSTGETDLATLLASLQPTLDPEDYVFVCLPPGTASDAEHADLLADALATFREREGMTLIVPAKRAPTPAPVFKRIEMRVHSSLEAVGMTAALSRALTDVGISANVVAAFYHDHVFVPSARASDAMAALRALASVGE